MYWAAAFMLVLLGEVKLSGTIKWIRHAAAERREERLNGLLLWTRGEGVGFIVQRHDAEHLALPL